MAMTIPFLDLVKRAKEKFEGRHRPTGPAPLPSVENKPESDKLAKRVMPYAVRTMTPEPTAPALAAASVIAARRIPATRPPVGTLGDLGPSAGVSVEPCGERTLSLALSDVITQMPDGYLKPHESFDTTRRVTLKAAEVEKGLAAGRPSIQIAAIYQQAPEIFLHTVQPSDPAVVVLPAQKVIDELSHLRVREDQTAEPIMAQVETPFLKLMVEESAKFGTTVAPFTTTELPPLPTDPRSSAPAAAEPASVEAVRPPPARPPIHPPRRRPLRRREFHSKCRPKLRRRKPLRKHRHRHRHRRCKRCQRLPRLPRDRSSPPGNRWSSCRCPRSWRISRRCRLPAKSLRC